MEAAGEEVGRDKDGEAEVRDLECGLDYVDFWIYWFPVNLMHLATRGSG
jgi:hypothetical protein